MQKFIFIIIIFFFSIIELVAQNNISELESKLKTVSGKEKTEILYKLSKLYLKSDVKKSLNYAEKSYNSAKKSKDKNMQANALNMIGTAYYQQKKYRSAIRNYEKELDLRKQLGQNYSKIKVEYNLAATYQISGKEKKALSLYKEVLDYSKKKKYPELTKKTYSSIIQVYVSEKDYKDAFLYLQEYHDYLNNIKTNYNRQKINLLETQFEEHEKELNEKKNRLKVIDSVLNELLIEKSTLVEDTIVKGLTINKLATDTIEKAKEIKIQKKEVKRREQWLAGAIIFIVVVLIFSFLLTWMYRRMKKAYKLLAIQNAEILEKNEEIKAQSELIKSQADKLAEQHQITLKQKQEIIDSINYAKRIQQAVFPTKEYIDKILNEHFILFKPRDIVSGDFYWMRKIKNFIIVVAADSTGHGVPGAFMSMLGVSFLNEIVSAKSLDNAGEILNRLRDKVKKSLHQTDVNSVSQDGMDIAFYIINTETLELQYSGAYNPLFIVRKNQEAELIEIKADRQPIAIFMREKEFSSYNIQLQKGDCLYTFSDGYADQFGGKKGQKFKLKNFKQILLDIYDLPMKEQKQILKSTLENWMGNAHEQLDDILVLGVRVDF
jgi:serine phosphatase RsbU (regulator of sigma subunit)